MKYSRKTLATPDNDFLDIDLLKGENKGLAIIIHGLEGDSGSSNVQGMALTLSKIGLDVAAMNQRGCSGRQNKQPRSYHSGNSADLKCVVDYFVKAGYKNIILVGFSLGGNVLLKYLGEEGSQLPVAVKASMAISVPCSLKDSAHALQRRENRVYLHRFLRQLKSKAARLRKSFPDINLDWDRIQGAQDFLTFDNEFTAPLNGFKDAEDYWKKCSSKGLVSQISSTTLIVNALDDPFLTPACHPIKESSSNPNVSLLLNDYGGHVGFVQSWKLGYPLWHEEIAASFFQSNIYGE